MVEEEKKPEISESSLGSEMFYEDEDDFDDMLTAEDFYDFDDDLPEDYDDDDFWDE